MENFEKYQEFTKSCNWGDLCKINGVQLDNFGTKKEIIALPKFLSEDEVVFALTSGIMTQTETSNASDFGTNTWLVVLTNERFLFLDAALLSSSIDTQSVRLDHVQAVSASQGFLFGKISIDLGSRAIAVDNCSKESVSVIADLANKWLKERENRKNNQFAVRLENTFPKSGLFDKLEKLVKLHQYGGLSDEELQEAKMKIFSSEEFKIEKQQLLSMQKY